jgi:hypothetical protein
VYSARSCAGPGCTSGTSAGGASGTGAGGAGASATSAGCTACAAADGARRCLTGGTCCASTAGAWSAARTGPASRTRSAATVAYLHDSRPLQNESPPFFTDHEGVDSICGSLVSGSTDAVLFYGTSQADTYAVELNPGIVPVPRNYGEAIMDPIYGAISRSLVLLYGPRPRSGARHAQPLLSTALGRLASLAL